MSAFLADTSFLITLVDDSRPHHNHAMRYLREAVERGATLYLSAVVIAEFHGKQPVTDLPLRHFRVLPFNIDHAMMAGELNLVLRRDPADPRDAIKDDVKLWLRPCACRSRMCSPRTKEPWPSSPDNLSLRVGRASRPCC